MEGAYNQSTVTFFLLQGLTSHWAVERGLFFLFLLDYLLILAGNLAIIAVIVASVQLHKPMYFLLSHLSAAEIGYTTSIMPNMLVGLLQDVKWISFAACFTQFYFIFAMGTTECLLLMMMGYDRYVAICKPLHYHKLMSSRFCHLVALSCWLGGLFWYSVPIVLISQLPFCGPNIINHFLCDRGPLVALSCQYDYTTELTFFVFATVLNLCNLSFILVSYLCILVTILRMPSATGRQKAFSTCASHLIVVSVFFGSVMFMNMRPAGKHSFSTDKLVALVYTVITPLLNPLIYALRSKDIKHTLWKLIKKE